jgi:hypothetical protein
MTKTRNFIKPLLYVCIGVVLVALWQISYMRQLSIVISDQKYQGGKLTYKVQNVTNRDLEAKISITSVYGSSGGTRGGQPGRSVMIPIETDTIDLKPFETKSIVDDFSKKKFWGSPWVLGEKVIYLK